MALTGFGPRSHCPSCGRYTWDGDTCLTCAYWHQLHAWGKPQWADTFVRDFHSEESST